MDLRSVFLFTPIRAKIKAQSVYNLRAKGEYLVRINEGLVDDIGFDNITDGLIYAKDQMCITDAPIQLIRKSTGETLQRIQ
jgi:hypothetical protein